MITLTLKIVQGDSLSLLLIQKAVGIRRAINWRRLAWICGSLLFAYLAAALPSVVYVEYYPFMDDLLEHGIEIAGGNILVPERPGHGVSFTPEARQSYQVF